MVKDSKRYIRMGAGGVDDRICRSKLGKGCGGERIVPAISRNGGVGGRMERVAEGEIGNQKLGGGKRGHGVVGGTVDESFKPPDNRSGGGFVIYL